MQGQLDVGARPAPTTSRIRWRQLSNPSNVVSQSQHHGSGGAQPRDRPPQVTDPPAADGDRVTGHSSSGHSPVIRTPKGQARQARPGPSGPSGPRRHRRVALVAPLRSPRLVARHGPRATRAPRRRVTRIGLVTRGPADRRAGDPVGVAATAAGPPGQGRLAARRACRGVRALRVLGRSTVRTTAGPAAARPIVDPPSTATAPGRIVTTPTGPQGAPRHGGAHAESAGPAWSPAASRGRACGVMRPWSWSSCSRRWRCASSGVQVFSSGRYSSIGAARSTTTVTVSAVRGGIYDRNGARAGAVGAASNDRRPTRF